MSSKYSKEELRQIAESLIDDLRECKDGTETTTGILARSNGYDDMDMDDLMELHDVLFRTAKAHHITLDMSAHEGKIEGLPYNLDFVVKNKKAQIKCPFCGSVNTARILYGMPAFSDELQKKIDEGKIAIGGCCVESVPVNGELVWTMPRRKCNDCGKEFGTPPLVIAEDRRSAEDYRDIVKQIRFEVGGYFGGFREITITRNDRGASVKTETTEFGKIPYAERQITAGKWNRILNELYTNMFLHEWKKEYETIGIMDGESWTLEIKLEGHRERSYRGVNAYPPYWSELRKLLSPFSPKKDK